MALTLNKLGRVDEAKKTINLALEIGRKILPANNELLIEMNETYDQIFKA